MKEAIDEGIMSVNFTRGAKTTGKLAKRSEEKHLSYKDSKKLMQEIYKKIGC